MNPITHFLVSWDVANIASLDRKDRTLVTLVGVIPDIDGFGAIPELLTRNSDQPLFWWTDYHHILGHNLPFGLFVTIGSFAIARKRWKTALLAFLTFHLHILGDVVGGRGPDSYQWPIPYLYPFSETWLLVWKGQWELNAWPNFVVTGIALFLMFFLAWRQGFSPLEMISTSANQAFVQTLRKRFGEPEASG
jgi:inner membrane protein